jgi:hypothetical protein
VLNDRVLFTLGLVWAATIGLGVFGA